MNIAILYGGKTGEHEVSMVSASSVARNIDATKHNINYKRRAVVFATGF